jgi:O-antigen/teichoic acid export membrane protein
MILFVLIFNLDVIFAKILFGAEIAGKYSVASLIGKIILFIVSSICTVMLPVSSEKYLRGNDTRNVLKKTLGLALIVCIFGMLAFLLFPKLILSILFGSRYISIYNILFYVGAGFSFISLLNIFLINAIATNKVGIKTVAILSTCLGVLIALFLVASKSIEAFSMGFMISGFISAIGGYLIYKYENFSNNANV